jgi:hypothetical protein
MARTPRPLLDAAAGNLLMLIALHQDKPCPTDAEIVDWTGVARRKVTAWLDELARRGVIEVEYLGGKPRRRRLRSVGGVWTGFTQRGRR